MIGSDDERLDHLISRWRQPLLPSLRNEHLVELIEEMASQIKELRQRLDRKEDYEHEQQDHS